MPEVIIQEHECKAKTGYNYEDLIHLTGILGIYTQSEIANLRSIGQYSRKVFYDDIGVLATLCVEIDSVDIRRLKIKILDQDEIYIDYFLLNPGAKGQSLGYKRLHSQIIEARNLKFKKLSLEAYGNIHLYNSIFRWEGYIVWGKYGFTMYEPNQIAIFNQRMIDERLNHCRDINILVKSKEGTALWKYIGDSWYGEFNLSTINYNMSLFLQYGFERGLLP